MRQGPSRTLGYRGSMRGAVIWVIAVSASSILAACGDGRSADTTMPDPPAPSATPTTTVAATVSATTTVPSTAAADTTTVTATGWVISDDYPSAVIQGYSGNWWGEGIGRSPAAPSDASRPVADGTYAVSLLSPWSPGDVDLRVRIQRLEWCSNLPADVCGEDGTDELGADPSWQLDLDVPLDDTTQVVVQGFDCRLFSGDASGELVNEQNKAGTGTDLLELFESFTTDYERVLRPYLNTDYWSDSATLRTDIESMPDPGGFRTGRQVCPDVPDADIDYDPSGILRYVHGDAPVLLLQSIEGWNNSNPDVDAPLLATDLVRVVGVDYNDGQPTFFFYAGFLS